MEEPSQIKAPESVIRLGLLDCIDFCPKSLVDLGGEITTKSPLHGQSHLPSGERLQFAMENHHAINGKIHYFYGHFQ